MKHFIHILFYIEPHSCLMHRYLLDNSSDRVVCTTYTRGSSGHSRKLSSETLITDKFTAIHLCHVCCRILTHLGALEVAFLFWGNSIICTPLTNFLSYVFYQVLMVNKHHQLELWSDGHFLFWMNHYCHQI